MRHKFILAGLLITAATPAFAQLDWLLREGNVQHTNSLAMTSNPAKYHLAWQTSFQPDANSKASWLMDLVVADKRIFYSYRTIDTDKKSHSNIYVLNTDTGKTAWSLEFPVDQDLDLTYQAGKLLSVGHTSEFTSLTAYDVKSGQSIYSVLLPRGIWSLTPYGDQTYFSQENLKIGNLDVNYGRINWVAPLAANNTFESGLSVNDHTILANDFDSVHLFNRMNGAEIKKISAPVYRPEDTAQPSPMIDDNNAYAVLKIDRDKWTGTLYAFELAAGKIKWSLADQYKEYSATVYRSIFMTNHTVFSFSHGLKALNAIDPETGKILWSWTIPADEYQHWSPPAIAATSDVIFIALTKHVYGISVATHEVVWKGDYAAKELALGDGKLYIVWEGDKMQGQDKERFISAIALN